MVVFQCSCCISHWWWRPARSNQESTLGDSCEHVSVWMVPKIRPVFSAQKPWVECTGGENVAKMKPNKMKNQKLWMTACHTTRLTVHLSNSDNSTMCTNETTIKSLGFLSAVLQLSHGRWLRSWFPELSPHKQRQSVSIIRYKVDERSVLWRISSQSFPFDSCKPVPSVGGGGAKVGEVCLSFEVIQFASTGYSQGVYNVWQREGQVFTIQHGGVDASLFPHSHSVTDAVFTCRRIFKFSV